MSTFPPVGPRGDVPVAYPRAEDLDSAEVSARLPVRWAGRMALVATLLAPAGCDGFLLYRPNQQTETEWGSGLMGDIAGEYWYHVTEDEAWAVVEAALHAEGFETMREIRTTAGDEAVSARVLQHRTSGDEVLVGLDDWGVELYRDNPEYATIDGSCAVGDQGGGCVETTCGEAADTVEDTCAVLGMFPSGEYWSWSEVPEHEAVIGDAAQRFISWARAHGHIPEEGS